MKKNSGFSYIEILIVVTLVVISSLGGTVSLLGFYRAQLPISAMKQVAAAARDAQQRSIAQEGGSYWGIRVENLSGRDRYSVFSASGADLSGYATSSVAYLGSGVQFSSPATSSAIVFDKMTGAWVSPLCPSSSASTTITAASTSMRIYCNGKIE